ncbi:GGDEF domain-containing protein [Echinimonas agarilytica]|uniref:diguanylate cyclase n=1 Tax=Echinimonas agarilytica TaxID=1215918 RepID=A0AA41W5S9_9GAMM|nr:GGDEF domain-containing protein [Echinimonas agarilytica]MCM2679142.1 GGDEF domain-containing protein [Echinimonas agarilytica]
MESTHTSHNPQEAQRTQEGSVFSVYYNERPSSLLSILQTELELEPLLRVYLEQVRQRVSLDGLILHSKNQQIEVGNTNSSYRLTVEWTIDDDHQVKLAYVSSHPFNAQKHQQLDWLQRQLHFPLRNSLRFEAMSLRARTDHLTGLGNRAAFDDQAVRVVAQSRRSRHDVAVLLIDLNHFKQVNDKFGHLTGDRILQATAECLLDVTRDSDQAFRIGGDEYAVLLSHCSTRSCDLVIRRIQSKLAQSRTLKKLGVSASIGAAMWTPADNVESWLCRADQAMYDDKKHQHKTLSA